MTNFWKSPPNVRVRLILPQFAKILDPLLKLLCSMSMLTHLWDDPGMSHAQKYKLFSLTCYWTYFIGNQLTILQDLINSLVDYAISGLISSWRQVSGILSRQISLSESMRKESKLTFTPMASAVLTLTTWPNLSEAPLLSFKHNTGTCLVEASVGMCFVNHLGLQSAATRTACNVALRR